MMMFFSSVGSVTAVIVGSVVAAIAGAAWLVRTHDAQSMADVHRADQWTPYPRIGFATAEWEQAQGRDALTQARQQAHVAALRRADLA